MKLSELKAIVERLVQHPRRLRSEDPKVVIQTENCGIPICRMVGVKSLDHGFDWTAGMVVVRTSESVVMSRGLGKPLRDFARDRLEQLKDRHARCGFRCIPKSRESEWLDGFVEGVRAHVTACSLPAPPTGEPGGKG
ncbi:MAG: hypothetical protein MUF54_19320 [Polyangiaceae bacterium]|jgi:hypothetical protein|nr:hypothetical protein [Polyangiaceae bacterium]